MNFRRLGRTELKISEIGWTRPEEADDVGRLLNTALDLGINLIDSSAAYRWSEVWVIQLCDPVRDRKRHHSL